MAGFETVTIKSTPTGFVDLDDLRAKLDDHVAVFMITNPNTLGLFDRQVRQIAEWSTTHGGLIYLDGANMNAILGHRPARRFRRRHDALQSRTRPSAARTAAAGRAPDRSA